MRKPPYRPTLPNIEPVIPKGMEKVGDQFLSELGHSDTIDEREEKELESANRIELLMRNRNLEKNPKAEEQVKTIVGELPVFPEVKNIAKTLTKSLSMQQAAFIEEYVANGGMTDQALDSVEATRGDYMHWRDNPEFNAALDAAVDRWYEELRRSAFIRAQQKSDVLLIFLLKALKPELYDDDIRKAKWLANQGLLGNQNVPVRATLVRDNTFNVVISGQEDIESFNRNKMIKDLSPDAPLTSKETKKNFNPMTELEGKSWSDAVDAAVVTEIIPTPGIEEE